VKSLAVLASRVRFEEKEIFNALERRSIRYTHVDTRQFTGGLNERQHGGPGFDAVLCREISHTRALYACLLLEAAGSATVNRAEVIGACGDKARTSLLLAAAGVPAPRTLLALTPEAALTAAAKLGFPVVVKPLTGSWGRLISVLRDQQEAEAVLEHVAALPGPQQHVVYLQELIDKPGRDIRVLVAGDEVIGATYRYGAQWRTGVARGGRSRPCPLSAELTGLALAAARAVGGGFLGVDLVEGGGGPQVIEVNHTPEFRGFSEAHGTAVDVAGAIVSYLLRAAA
jgi:[lysine-biosynthesis-protein LysW]--L-2-aminoadipate ligase